jgi:magnesium transporter
MAEPGPWIDLLDPSDEELGAHLPPNLHETDLGQLRARGAAGRPKLASHDDHIVGVLLIAVVEPSENDVFYQEVDVVLTREQLVTVRKTTPGRAAYDPTDVRSALRPSDGPAVAFYRLMDDVAERYLDLVDDLEAEIAELEDQIEELEPEHVSRRVRQVRHQILHVRRNLAPMRDAVRAVADGRIDLEGAELLTRDIELGFAGVHDTFMRAADGLELAHDLLAAARDYHQAKIANDVNDVVRRLTAVASLILVPTFIVGLYGQNFISGIPEFGWGGWGYVWSWALIVATTLGQLVLFRWKGWL